MSTNKQHNAGAFRMIDGVATEYDPKAEAAIEWDCEIDELAECERCRVIEPHYVQRTKCGYRLCELCFDK